MKFYQLNALVAVADAGSIRGAAKRLDTSPAAVTKAVQKLESEISLQLLVRNTSGIDFTERASACWSRRGCWSRRWTALLMWWPTAKVN